jgi:hypothetical protein
VRAFPFPGEEGVLWESLEVREGKVTYLPSPAFTRVAVTWWVGLERPRVFVVPLAAGQPEEVPDGGEFAWWQDDDTLVLLSTRSSIPTPAPLSCSCPPRGGTRPAGGVESSYDIGTKRLAVVQGNVSVLPRLESLHAVAIRILEGLTNSGTLPLEVRQGEPTCSILLGVGFPPFIPLVKPEWIFASAVAAVSPDGRYLALGSGRAGAVYICSLRRAKGSVTGCSVVKEIALPRLIEREGLGVRDLRWSADSKHLTFTEVHHHPAMVQPPDIGVWVPDPLDTTELVRMYSLTTEGGELATIAVGSNAFLMPPSWKPPHGTAVAVAE